MQRATLPAQPTNSLTGYLLVDKPKGITSHDVVYKIRKITSVKKVGHAGTLDPLATGLLIILVGKGATKQSNKLIGLDKSYKIDMDFGYQTDSLDSDGEIVQQLEVNSPKLLKLNADDIEKAISSFQKTYAQTVPLFSAVKIDGKKMYHLGYKARRTNEETSVTLPTRTVTIYKIANIKIEKELETYPHASFTAQVSSGTYTRSLVRDIGETLGVPTTQTALRRLSVGPFSINESIPLDEVSKNDIIPVEHLMERLNGYGAIV